MRDLSCGRIIFGMGTCCYYVAVSIDGFIAKADDSLDWVRHIPQHNSFSVLGGEAVDLFEYHRFFSSVDVLVMGRRTFEVLMSFMEFPYPDKRVFVCTRGEVDTRDLALVTVTNEDPVSLVDNLKHEFKNRIWIVGGGGLAATLMKGGVIDEIILTLVPTVLGSGIRLFGEGNFEQDWERKELVALNNGLTQIRFQKKRKGLRESLFIPASNL
ncbi:dihydrofolate reductase family protein [Bdellovibrio sp. SKB1291214]|uniref:dihydrofolate reductase family protein n=1 Tax=Bdellovibrio sp. SKB1291214 TaxID=1732569 RepID=UPI001130A860|nr:dihydrofolate reductase family protein [Bdellovibrio sp. SKB1291214]UYL08450.1 dihydrofolate reductase family protein [Bdellovibrio sp. SKB1291214]